MCHHYLMILQQWLSFICHDGRVLHLLARHCIDAQSYVCVCVCLTISFVAQNLVNCFEVHSVGIFLLCYIAALVAIP